MIWTLVILALVVIGWYGFEASWDRRLFRGEAGRVCVNVRPHEAQAFLVAHPETQIVDVRSAKEFKSGALPGAVQASVDDPEFAEKVGSLDRERPVLVYCAGGFRSRKAVGELKRLAFQNIVHLHRGYHSWRLAELPVARTGNG